MIWLAIILLLAGCAPVSHEGDADIVNTYTACRDDSSCVTDRACIRGVCTLPCVGSDARTCPIAPAGMEAVCVESRCLLACDGVCVAGTMCQRIGPYDVCAR